MQSRIVMAATAAFSVVFLSASEGRCDDQDDIRVLKEEMRRLQAKVRILEAKQAKPQTAAPRGQVPQSAGGTPTQNGAQPTAPVQPTPIATPFAITLPDNHKHNSAINLRSSSPAAITQTAVDSLPPILTIGGVSLTLGGFIELSNIYRDKNMTSGPATAWGSTPYFNDPNAHTSEYRISGQLTRLSALAKGEIDDHRTLGGYIEADFGGAAGTANSYQISGYNARIRQAYMSYDDNEMGFHFIAGQAWSLATNYTKALLPRQEQVPPVVDNNQIPGIVFTRVPQMRLVKDFDQKYWIGLSAEESQANYAFSPTTASGDVLPPAFGSAGGTRVVYNNAGGVLLNSLTRYSFDAAPDIILKGAANTSFGHYEVFGLGRWFRSLALPYGSPSLSTKTVFAGGIGAGTTIPIMSKLDFTGNILVGKGIGRYGPSLIPDATFNADGSPSPIPELIASIGFIGHPRDDLLLYAYGGIETAKGRTYFGPGNAENGYGANNLNLAGCNIVFATCNAQLQTLTSFTLGGWWHMLKGRYGSLMSGLQYTYIHKYAFAGNNGTGQVLRPNTEGNTLYVTFRYFPFQ